MRLKEGMENGLRAMGKGDRQVRAAEWATELNEERRGGTKSEHRKWQAQGTQPLSPPASFATSTGQVTTGASPSRHVRLHMIRLGTKQVSYMYFVQAATNDLTRGILNPHC